MALSAQPKANRDPAWTAAKRARLGEPHIAPLSRFVQRIRAETGKEVPDFDPDMGGARASALILLESPSRRGVSLASGGSGLISPDNNDETARTSWELYREAGLSQDRVAVWNIVPWYIGTPTKNEKPTAEEILASRPYLERLLDLLADLKVVLLVGNDAKKGWAGYATGRREPDWPVLACPHPGPTNIRTRPLARGQILAALRQVQSIIA